MDLASYGAEPPLKDFQPDVGMIRRMIEEVVDNGQDVVLFMHSYAGVVGCEACKGLDKQSRQEQGQSGGVIRLFFCAAFLAPEGASLLDMLNGKPLPWFNISDDQMTVNPANPEGTFYNDVDPVIVRETKTTLKSHSYQTFYSKLTYPAWRDIPVTFLFCKKDKAIPIEAQEGMVAASKVDVIREMADAGHSPFLSVPDQVVAALRRAAGKTL